MKKQAAILIAALALTGCTGNQDVIQKSLDNIKDEMLGIQSTMGDMQVQIQELDKNIRINTESINRNSDALAQLREEMTVTNTDLMDVKERVGELEKTKMELAEAKKEPVEMEESGEKVLVIGDNIQDKISMYTYAYELYRNGKYAESEGKFEEFIRQYPDVERSDNAMYWLGEIKYAQKDYEASISKFQMLIDRYPDGNKVPDALLKLGYSYGNLSDKDNAVGALQKVVDQYPDSGAARLAKQKLRFWGVN